MLKIILIRHGQTFGNSLQRYVGTTDEDLLPSGITELQNKVYPKADVLYVSPMKRCKQTAKIIYEDKKATVIEDLKECDFGDFENKNYKELKTNKDYQKWMETQTMLEFPNGENLENFSNRNIKAFDTVVETHKNEDITIAFVAHGGTIMNIMAHLHEKKDTYDWFVKNGCGYQFTLNDNKIEAVKEI